MIRLTAFLLPTEFCDSDNFQIDTWAQMIIRGRGRKNPIEQAKLIKEWVQCHIKYRADFRNIKASETLSKGFGQCSNRANLQIAFLRILKVPAGYAIVGIKKELFKSTSPPEFYERISQPTTHVYCVVYDTKFERWRHFDLLPHLTLYRALQKIGKAELRSHNSEGESKYKSEYLASEICIHSNIDHLFKVPPRWLNEEYIKKANRYLKNLEKENLEKKNLEKGELKSSFEWKMLSPNPSGSCPK